ncbi:MAG: Uma2 family endonuclease [Pyrinomonadaceae bacterium]
MNETATIETIAIADTYLPTRFPKRFRSARMHINFEPGPDRMSVDEFWQFCADNDKLRAELTKEGDVIIMPPTGFESGDINLEILIQLGTWSKQDKTGIATDSNAGFILPSGAVKASDGSWTLKDRVEQFSSEERKKFLRLCPDFIIELRSQSDIVKELLEKMDEWIENGVRLAWLIDPYRKQVHIYRPDRDPEILDDPKIVSGEDVLSGFELDLTEIW